MLIERVNGDVPIVSGSVGVAADGVTPTTVDAALDPAHINTGDSDRDGDLTGTDWFDTKAFPRWTFKSDRIETNAEGTYSVRGILTIHGTPVPVTLATTLVHGAPHPAYRATAKIDRHAFGMTVTRTDALIGNEIEIELDVQTK